MAECRIGQLDWTDAALSGRRQRGRDKLGERSGLLDWAALVPLLPEASTSWKGEPAYPLLLMFKVLLLRWYVLSDAKSFGRLAIVPPAGRQRGDPEAGNTDRRQPDPHCGASADHGGRSVQCGQSRCHLRRQKREAALHVRLQCACGGRFGSNRVRRLSVTPAHVQEVMEAPGLVLGDEMAVYADRCYDGRRLHDHLTQLGNANGVMRRHKIGKPLSEADIALNHRSRCVGNLSRGVRHPQALLPDGPHGVLRHPPQRRRRVPGLHRLHLRRSHALIMP